MTDKVLTNNTLGYHRKITAAIFGKDSLATKFLDEKIEEYGEEEEEERPQE